MKEIKRQRLSGERALFMQKDSIITDSVFFDGESPLKHSKNIDINNCFFRWKYPLWYSENIRMTNCTLYEMARAGIWYTNSISLKNCIIEAPKSFRRAGKISLENVNFSNALETMWSCEDVKLKNVSVANGDYLLMNSSDIEIDSLNLIGNYAFDGAKNVTIRNSQLLTKDAFWNSENVTVYDSFISGEYLGWNSKNLTLINCTVESLQGMCFIENLVMKNCRTVDTTLAFEYSTVDVRIEGKIDSVKNPISGIIEADEIGELIMENEMVDPSATKIIIGKEKE